MATKLPKKDVAIIGLGWTSAILANELTDQGLDVVAIERGPWRDTATAFNIGYAPDELRYAVRLDLFQRPAEHTHVPQQRQPDRVADPAVRLIHSRQRRRRRGYPLERPNVALSAE
jgi:gluconate 2-dehydrogenase alpha chain